MKHNNKLFFSTLLFVAMFLPNMAIGQDAIYELPWISAKKSIVREYNENIAIVYAYDGGDGCFSFVDMASLNCRYAKIPGLVVNDFEIFEESVYFCGSHPAGNVVGYFDINSTFFMGASAQFAVMPTSMACPNPSWAGTENIVRLDRIEVMGNPGGKPHMLLTGESTCSAFPVNLNHCIIDVYYNGTGWEIAISQEHQSIFHFDDIAVTPHDVVVVGNKHQSNGEYIFSLPRPTSPFDNIFSFMPYPVSPSYTAYSYGGGWPYFPVKNEDILIEHIDGDIFATICHGGFITTSGIFMGTVLNIYNTVSSVVQRLLVPDTSAEYKDLKFNKSSNSLFLLPGTNSSTLTDGYIEYVLDGSFTRVLYTFRHHNIPGTPEGSLDAAPKTYMAGSGQSFISSVGASKLQLWRHKPLSGCSYTDDIKPTPMSTYGGGFEFDIWYNMHTVLFNNYTPNVQSGDLISICGSKE